MKPVSSLTRYLIVEEGLRLSDPRALGFMGTYSPSSPYLVLLEVPQLANTSLGPFAWRNWAEIRGKVPQDILDKLD